MRNLVGTVPARQVTTGIVDDRVAMSADLDDFEVRVLVPEPDPLSATETHLALAVKGDGVRASIELDAEGVDALADAIHHSRDGDRQERDRS